MVMSLGPLCMDSSSSSGSGVMLRWSSPTDDESAGWGGDTDIGSRDEGECGCEISNPAVLADRVGEDAEAEGHADVLGGGGDVDDDDSDSCCVPMVVVVVVVAVGLV